MCVERNNSSLRTYMKVFLPNKGLECSPVMNIRKHSRQCRVNNIYKNIKHVFNYMLRLQWPVRRQEAGLVDAQVEAPLVTKEK